MKEQLKGSNLEGYKDTKYFSRFFNRSGERIRQLADIGVISCNRVKGVNYYPVIPTIHNYIKYLQEKADKILSDVNLERELLEADLRLAKAHAQKANIEASRLEESLLPARDVKLFVEHLLMTFEKTFSALPEEVTNEFLAKNIICSKDAENCTELIKELNKELITQITNKFKFDINFYKERLQEDKKVEFFDDEDDE